MVRSMTRYQRGMTSKSLVEEADLHRLFLLLEWREGRQEFPHVQPEEAAERLSARAQSMSLDELREHVERRVEQQVRRMVLCDSDDGNSQRPSFNLDVRRSTIPNAGRGVFVEGSASLGEVVALMPGISYSAEQIRDIPGYPSFGNDSMLMMVRHDGHVIDSRAWERFKSNSMRKYNASRRKREGIDHVALLNEEFFDPGLREEGASPFAFGHLINHPPKDLAPNVLAAPVDWTLEAEEERSRIPWCLFGETAGVSRAATRAGTVDTANAVDAIGEAISADRNVGVTRPRVPGLAFVATRPIEDEELLVNYRLNPGVLGGLPKVCLVELQLALSLSLTRASRSFAAVVCTSGGRRRSMGLEVMFEFSGFVSQSTNLALLCTKLKHIYLLAMGA